MSAETRLRHIAEVALNGRAIVETADLRALLDAYDAARAQVDAARETAGYMDNGWRITDAMNAAFAKAGRR